MPAQKPVARHFLVCDRVEVSSDGRRVTLVNIIYAITPLPGAQYPRIQPEICVFAQLTDGMGEVDLAVELVFYDDDNSIFRTQPVRVDFGSDPLAVRGWTRRFTNVLFQMPGLYEFRLLCDGEIIARESILLRETP
jgi:hypothetical protein